MGFGVLVKFQNPTGSRLQTQVATDDCMHHMSKWAHQSIEPNTTVEHYVEASGTGTCFASDSSFKVKVVVPYGDGSGSDTMGYFGVSGLQKHGTFTITSHTELGYVIVAQEHHKSKEGYLVVTLTGEGCSPQPGGPTTVSFTF